MIDTNNKKVREVLEEIHKSLQKRNQKLQYSSNNIVLESALISVFCHSSSMSPYECANNMNTKFYDGEKEITSSIVLRTLNKMQITDQESRKSLFNWAKNLSELFSEATIGNRTSFEKFEKILKESPVNGRYINCQERIVAISIFELNKELNIFKDLELLFELGNTMARYALYNMSDAVANAYGFPVNKDNNNYKKDKPKLSYEQAIARNEFLENKILQTDNILRDLQNEFEGLIEEAKIKELTDFFSRLNSEKYGCILDELLVLRKGIDDLRKQNYELPIEINGLLIMVKKLILFIRDSHIVPIKKINEIITVKANDVEYFNYDGSPFINEEEEKRVKVVSPGWVYKDKEIQISRPKVKEEK